MPTTQPTQDATRRDTYRAAFVVEVNIHSDHTFWTGFTDNLSMGGVFLASRKLLPLGARLQFDLKLPDDGPTAFVTGEVRWYRDERAGAGEPGGMGLQFVELDQALKARISRFVKSQRETLFFDNEDA